MSLYPICAAMYARYSSHEQGGGESIEFQVRKPTGFIENQGWALPSENIFIDRTRSGTTTYRRDAFNRMLGLVKEKDCPFKVIVGFM